MYNGPLWPLFLCWQIKTREEDIATSKQALEKSMRTLFSEFSDLVPGDPLTLEGFKDTLKQLDDALKRARNEHAEASQEVQYAKDALSTKKAQYEQANENYKKRDKEEKKFLQSLQGTVSFLPSNLLG